MIKIIAKERSPQLRHLHRTHRIDVHWLFEVCSSPRVLMRYVNTSYQIADIFTKAITKVDLWNSLLDLGQIRRGPVPEPQSQQKTPPEKTTEEPNTTNQPEPKPVKHSKQTKKKQAEREALESVGNSLRRKAEASTRSLCGTKDYCGPSYGKRNVDAGGGDSKAAPAAPNDDDNDHPTTTTPSSSTTGATTTGSTSTPHQRRPGRIVVSPHTTYCHEIEAATSRLALAPATQPSETGPVEPPPTASVARVRRPQRAQRASRAQICLEACCGDYESLIL